MDPIAIILDALKAGALFVGGKMAGEAVKDSYTKLKTLLRARVKSNEERTALIPTENLAVDVWQARAREILERINAGKDLDLVGAAQNLLTQVNQTQTSSGKFNLQANTISTVIQGDYANIILEGPDKKAAGE